MNKIKVFQNYYYIINQKKKRRKNEQNKLINYIIFYIS